MPPERKCLCICAICIIRANLQVGTSKPSGQLSDSRISFSRNRCSRRLVMGLLLPDDGRKCTSTEIPLAFFFRCA